MSRSRSTVKNVLRCLYTSVGVCVKLCDNLNNITLASCADGSYSIRRGEIVVLRVFNCGPEATVGNVHIWCS